MLRYTLRALFALLLLTKVVAAGTGERVVRITVTDADGNPVPQAVVWFGEMPTAASDEKDVVVDQIDKQFVPQLTVIRAGTEVEFPNSDTVSHHVYSFAQPNNFELPLYRSGETPRIRFTHPGIVTLGCNIHDSMLGYIVVVDAAEYAITGDLGVALFTHLPAPDAEIHVWSPQLSASGFLIAARSSTAPQVLTVRVPASLYPDASVSDSSLAWEDY